MTSRRIASAVLFVLCLTGSVVSAADRVVFVVRHAERADAAGGTPPAGMMANDPPLSAAGRERAKRLASLLSSAEVSQIFTTELARTKQTAAPLAEAVKVPATVTPSRDTAALAQQVRNASGNVLVVGHSNTIPELLKQLGVSTAVAIGDHEYDNLFVVVRHAAGEPTLVRLRY